VEKLGTMNLYKNTTKTTSESWGVNKHSAWAA